MFKHFFNSYKEIKIIFTIVDILKTISWYLMSSPNSYDKMTVCKLICLIDEKINN